MGILYRKVSEISVWWSDFRLLQDVSKETQPGDLPAKYLEEFHEAPAIIERKKKKEKMWPYSCVTPVGSSIYYTERCSLTFRINGMTKTYGEQRRLYS